MASVEDIVNQALVLVGYQRMIGDIYDGSTAARVALALFYETRQEQLYQGDWQFARKQAAGSAGATPPSPWTQSYARPADCVRMRSVKPGPLTGGTRATDPRPILWEEGYLGTDRVIFTDQATATLVYTADVADPNDWDTAFTATVIYELAQKFRVRLAGQGAQQVTEQPDARQQS